MSARGTNCALSAAGRVRSVGKEFPVTVSVAEHRALSPANFTCPQAQPPGCSARPIPQICSTHTGTYKLQYTRGPDSNETFQTETSLSPTTHTPGRYLTLTSQGFHIAHRFTAITSVKAHLWGDHFWRHTTLGVRGRGKRDGAVVNTL